MSTTTLQPTLPWSAPFEEDHRFRRILLACLAGAVIVGGIFPYLPLPNVKPPWEAPLPPRLAQLIGDRVERSGPAAGARAAPSPPSRAKPQRKVAPPTPRPEPTTAPTPRPEANKPATAEQPTQANRTAAARRRAESSGILALSDSLAELRNSAADIDVATPGIRSVEPTRAGATNKPSALSATLTIGSGGIAGDALSHREVLRPPGGTGGSGIDERVGGLGKGVGSDNPGSGTSRGRDSSTRGTRLARSEEEIQEILEKHKRAMYTLYNRALRLDPRLEGKVVVSLTIAPSGRVTECLIAYSELEAKALEQKLVLLIKRIDFGAKPGVPAVTTRVPIEFFPT